MELLINRRPINTTLFEFAHSGSSVEYGFMLVIPNSVRPSS